MVGYLSYDSVRRWERLPDANPDEIGIPEVAMLLATDLAVLDHHDGSVLLIANAINYDDSDERVDDAWADAVRRLDAMAADLATQLGGVGLDVRRRRAGPGRRSRTERDDYLAGVEACKEYIRAGDAFQIVLSQRFSAPCTASSLDVYRVLRVTNPSPYMYLLRVPVVTDDGSLSDEVAFDVVGSSPEALVKVADGRALLHPIAGSRPRGATPEARQRRSREELLADEKERAEHLMLVDLGRNDLGRVCAPGTRRGRRLHVGRALQPHHAHRLDRRRHARRRAHGVRRRSPPPSPRARSPGAPKPRAMEIIDELEPVRRGVYGGAVGYLDFAGDLDTAIAIRTAVIKDGVAHVQAGGGLVADSVPETEDQECRNKAAAVLRAVAMAVDHATCGLVSDQAAPEPGAASPRPRTYAVALSSLALGGGAAVRRLRSHLGHCGRGRARGCPRSRVEVTGGELTVGLAARPARAGRHRRAGGAAPRRPGPRGHRAAAGVGPPRWCPWCTWA